MVRAAPVVASRKECFWSCCSLLYLTTGAAGRRTGLPRWYTHPPSGGECSKDLLESQPHCQRGGCIAAWTHGRLTAKPAQWTQLWTRSVPHRRGPVCRSSHHNHTCVVIADYITNSSTCALISDQKYHSREILAPLFNVLQVPTGQGPNLILTNGDVAGNGGSLWQEMAPTD